jgi:hypothetical protein
MIQPYIKDSRAGIASILLVFSITGSIAHASDDNKSTSEFSTPDRELLEFIAEFADTDDETFELVFFYGRRDANNADQKTEQEETVNEN